MILDFLERENQEFDVVGSENHDFRPKMGKNHIFWFHVLIDGSVALWGGAARQKSCSPGLSSK